MDLSTKPYLVERLGQSDGIWRPLTACGSLDYARMIAATGLRRRIGVAYRAIDSRTGLDIPLGSESCAQAA